MSNKNKAKIILSVGIGGEYEESMSMIIREKQKDMLVKSPMEKHSHEHLYYDKDGKLKCHTKNEKTGICKQCPEIRSLSDLKIEKLKKGGIISQGTSNRLRKSFCLEGTK